MGILERRLREHAKELSLADSEVARRAGLSERRYAHYAAGTREPDMATLVRICRVLNTTPNYLLGVTDSDASGNERSKIVGKIDAAIAVLSPSDLLLAHDLLTCLIRQKRRPKRA